MRTLSVAVAATNRTSSERCGMSLLLTQDISDSELERSGDSLPRFAPGGSTDARIRAGVLRDSATPSLVRRARRARRAAVARHRRDDAQHATGIQREPVR